MTTAYGAVVAILQADSAVAAVAGCALSACAVPDRNEFGLEAVAQERAPKKQLSMLRRQLLPQNI